MGRQNRLVNRESQTAADPPTADSAPPRDLASSALHDRRAELVCLAYRFCWNRSDAEDAVQNALLIAAQRTDQLRDPQKRLAWAKAIVVRQCLSINRRAKHRQEPAWVGGRETGSPEGRVLQEELSSLLREHIRKLPERQQTALVLRHLEHMAYSQIAQLMQIGESTVRVLVRNAREALRGALSRQNPEWTRLQ